MAPEKSLSCYPPADATAVLLGVSFRPTREQGNRTAKLKTDIGETEHETKLGK